MHETHPPDRSGRRPYDGEDPTHLDSDVADTADQVFAAIWALLLGVGCHVEGPEAS